MAKIIDLDRLSRFKDKLDTELDKKANVNGNYPTMTVGVAEQLQNVSENTGSTQTAPFLFQATGTDNNTTETPTAPIANHLELRGNSVAFNQLVPNGNFASSSGWSSANGSISISNNECVYTQTSQDGTKNSQIYRELDCIVGHKYLISATIETNVSYTDKVICLRAGGLPVWRNSFTANTPKTVQTIFTATSTGTYYTIYAADNVVQLNDTIKVKNCMLIDLTQLGVDYQDVVSFNRDYPLPYYSYNAGELRNCSSQALETIGQNQWDEEWEIGGISSSSGANDNTITNRIRSKNYIRVIQGKEYYFTSPQQLAFRYYDANKNYIGNIDKNGSGNGNNTTRTMPDNCCYIRFSPVTAYGTTYQNNIMLCLYWGAGEDYSYKPFEKNTYQLPILDEPLKSAGSAYDILKADGTLIRNIGVVDLGILNFSRSNNSSTWNNYLFFAQVSDLSLTTQNIICSKYQSTSNPLASMENQTIRTSSNYIYIRDDTYTDAATFKAAMSGVYLYYELATPTETQDTTKAFTENIIVDDMGTMRFVPIDNASEPIIPQGNKFFYPADYVLFIDDMYNRSKDGGDDADANNFVVQSELGKFDDNYDIVKIFKENMGGALRHQLASANSIDFLNTSWLDLSSLIWSISSSRSNQYKATATSISSNNNGTNILCGLYLAQYTTLANLGNFRMRYSGDSLYITDESCETLSQFEAKIKGILLAYEKA